MGARILVADDSVTIQKVVELTFSKEDFELVQARSGQEAIRKAKETRPDLMLIDLMMPDKNGYEVCAALRGDPILREVPIILLTGTFESFDRDEGVKAGANDFVAKPFESQQLISKVKQLLFARTVRPGAAAPEVAAPVKPRPAALPAPAVAPPPRPAPPRQAPKTPADLLAALERPAPAAPPPPAPPAAPPILSTPSTPPANGAEEELSEEKLWELLDADEAPADTSRAWEATPAGAGAETALEFEAAEAGAPLPSLGSVEALGGAPGEQEDDLFTLEPIEEGTALDADMDIFAEREPVGARTGAPDLPASFEEPASLPGPDDVEGAALGQGAGVEAIAREAAEALGARVAGHVADQVLARIEHVLREVLPEIAERLITREIERIRASITDRRSG